MVKFQYFAECTTKDEAAALYRELAKKHHPDITGGDNELMSEINTEYNAFLVGLEFSQQIVKPKPRKKMKIQKKYKDEIIESVGRTAQNVFMSTFEILFDKYFDEK